MLPQIYLVRHGETEWSLSGRHTSRTDLPLTPRGEEQARGVGQRLRGLPLTRAIVSPRLRAQRTYELSGLTLPPEIDPEVREWEYGEYEGLTSVDVLAQRPDWKLYRDGFPGGESIEQMTARADRVVAKLQKMEGNIVIFSHGHFLRIFGMRWIRFPLEAAQRFGLTTASLSILGFDREDLNRPVITLWNLPPVLSGQ